MTAARTSTEASFPAAPPTNSSGPWGDPTTRKIDLGTAIATALNNQSQKSIKELFYNGTGYYIEDEAEPSTFLGGLNDLQTLFLACFATLIPLVISLLTAFGIRILWTRYKQQKENSKYDGIHRKGSQDSINKPLHSHLLNSDKKCGETHLAISTDDVEVCDGTGVSQIRSNNHSSTNGSIITMTLKNNHLIVETEERNDIEEDSRETTMKYSPGARDGVFVVEVQQGVRRSPSSGGGPASGGNAELSASVSDQCALVHNPPDRYSDDETLEECDDNDFYVDTTSPNKPSLAEQVRTGLAQSDTSLTSSHQSYCYTNQQCYDNGSYGYSTYHGYINDEPFGRRVFIDNNKPKITAALYKNQLNKGGFTIDEDGFQVEQRRLGNTLTSHISIDGAAGAPLPSTSSSIRLQNDISPTVTKTEPDVRSAEYENGGFEEGRSSGGGGAAAAKS